MLQVVKDHQKMIQRHVKKEQNENEKMKEKQKAQ